MMVAWYWLILAFCVGIAFATITDEWCDWENTLTDVLAWIALIIGFVPLTFYCIFLKLTVFYPTTREKFEEVKKVSEETCKIYRVCGNVYFWIDLKATKIYNKVFFIRVKETKNNG